MDVSEPQAIVNRDDPIPMLKVEDVDHGSSDEDHRSGRLSPKRLKDTIRTSESSPLRQGVSDRLFSAIFSQVFPSAQEAEPPAKPDRRSRKYVDKPNFSMSTMSGNFRRFNARIGVVFVFQNRVIKLLSWNAPTQTLSFLAIYTFCCLDPNLLLVTPLAACLFFVMVPAYSARHPPPPGSDVTDIFAIQGPASAPPPNIKPAPDMSKDFFRNMRDLQNSMEDFSVMHDRLISILAPLTNFSDEQLSSTIFIVLFIITCTLFVGANLIPWRFIFLVSGWALVSSNHPSIKSWLQRLDRTELRKQQRRAQTEARTFITQDILLDSAPEMREVEIFELQRLHAGSNSSTAEWEPWVYSNSPYDPLSPLRISGDRPRGTMHFEDVRPPTGWEWRDKKWTLDLESQEWVANRMITAVEVEMEGERWVYDIAVSDAKDFAAKASSSKSKSVPRKKDWEEAAGAGAKGEWRRRRWVRLVTRKVIKKTPN